MKKVLGLVTFLFLSFVFVGCSQTTEVTTTSESNTIALTTEGVDETPPVISLVDGAQTTYFVGSNQPVWTSLVTANDSIDGAITITESMVDISEVDMDSIGSFSVVYTVSDSANNESSMTLIIDIEEFNRFTNGEEKFSYQFDSEYSGELALPNLLEGNGYVVNDEGYAETIYVEDQDLIFGHADSWTFVSNGYDKDIHNFVLEAKVIALGQETGATSPIFSIRVDYDWMLDIHFSFNNASWSGIAVHNVPGGSRYSNDASQGGLDPNGELDLALNTAYIFKIIIVDSETDGMDTLRVYVDGTMYIETDIPDVDPNAQHIMGASVGSHIKVDYFKCNLVIENILE